MNVVQRVKAPTPKFFKIVRAIGLSLVVAGGAILASPVAVPGAVSIASYSLIAGSVMSAVSQTAVQTTKTAPVKKRKAIVKQRKTTVKKAKADEPHPEQ